MKVHPSATKSCALALAAGYFLGLGSGAFCSPALTQSSGYHTESASASRGATLLSPPVGALRHDELKLPELAQIEEAVIEPEQIELLSASLKAIKESDLSSAADLLAKLVAIAPQEPRYAQLLAIVRRQLQTESWYRYQRHFGLGWARDPL